MPARRPVLVSTALAAVAAATVALPATSAGAQTDRPLRGSDRSVIAQVHAGIAKYRDVDAALAAGYFRASGCEVSPEGEGGMGIHYLNPEFGQPGPVDVAKPAILLYAPGPDGELQLLGAEYWQPSVGQATPTLAGQPFDGPMDGHGPGMPEHYDLHVWTEVANPSGVFAPWNPDVSC